MDIGLAIVGGLAGAAGAGSLWIYNRFVFLRNRQREAWSGIDVQLRKRHDLVPALVECVKGYRAHESATFERVTAARAEAEAADTNATLAAAENRLTDRIRGLFAVAEAYPDLKASANFQQLSAQLVAIEDDLQYARRYYNGSVRDFRNLAESFPSNLIATAFRFAPGEFFEIETATERNAPSVQL